MIFVVTENIEIVVGGEGGGTKNPKHKPYRVVPHFEGIKEYELYKL